ncbi:hypothetical protein [Streptomyces sp. Ag109_G2-15]|uniref:hypothetical protein n=1 Tax=Streptomyces sp. Ag109_G2-15 TaxID=1938850 RepID=UPI000BDD372E|nr:hypothetical protein [Streptomyces sp. Ag109_G2-15]SOD89692.1 hypothetical protein SAMN06272765_6217 [Streptomyces sp. Ag109_G2-15]
MIDSLTVLTGPGSAALRDAVHGLRRHWTPRGPEPAAFFTLGAPSYLDLAPDPESGVYQKRADVSRPLLENSFDWLYARLAAVLGEHLGAPVHYPEHLALPGFHVWLSAAVFTKPTAPMHFDLQYRAFSWPPGTDLKRQISFTLPVRLPAAGGGLNLWDVSHEQFRHALEKGWIESAADLKRFHALRYIPYTVGRMVIHSGHTLHQVAPSTRVEPDDERLTLQGHGVWCDGRWLLYW